MPGERLTDSLARELATEALACRDRLARLDRDLETLLARHPDAALIRSLPGLGANLTAEFIAQAGDLGHSGSADQLAAAAGLARSCASVRQGPLQRRPIGGNKDLKRVFYQSAFCPLSSPDKSRLLAPQTTRGQTSPPGLDRLGPPQNQRAVGDPAHPPAVPGQLPQGGLTNALGCHLSQASSAR